MHYSWTGSTERKSNVWFSFIVAPFSQSLTHHLQLSDSQSLNKIFMGPGEKYPLLLHCYQGGKESYFLGNGQCTYRPSLQMYQGHIPGKPAIVRGVNLFYRLWSWKWVRNNFIQLLQRLFNCYTLIKAMSNKKVKTNKQQRILVRKDINKQYFLI